MSIPKSETVVQDLQNHFGINLRQMAAKRIFYTCKLNGDEELIVCTPKSKLHRRGNGWIDLTLKQVSLLAKYKNSILAFRLEGNKVYYLDFHKLKMLFTKDAMVNNKNEGDHWKLNIWPAKIEIIGNKDHFSAAPNNLEELVIL